MGFNDYMIAHKKGGTHTDKTTALKFYIFIILLYTINMPRGKKQPLIGNGMNANLLKEFIDLSYKGNTSIAPAGYSIDTPLSDSRVKVYTKNNSKDVIVTHRGSVSMDDWIDNATYMFRGKTKGTKTYNLHRERHKKAVDKYGAKNIIALGHSRAGLYIQELNKEFPMKEIISYNKASGFFDIGKTNADNQTDVRVGNDIVSLLAPLQKNPNAIVKIDGTKNPLDFNTAHQTSELDKLGTTFIGKKDDREEMVGGARAKGTSQKDLIAKFSNVILYEDDIIISNVLKQMDLYDYKLYSPMNRADGLKRLLTSNTGRAKLHHPLWMKQPYTNEGYYRRFKVAEFMSIYDNIKAESDKGKNAFAEKYKNKDVIFVKKYKSNVYFHQYTGNNQMFDKSDAYVLKDGIVSILGYIKLRDGRDWRDGMKGYDHITQGYDDVEPNVRFSLQDTDDKEDKVLTKWNKLQDKRQNDKVGKGLCCSRFEALPPSQVMTNRGNVNTVNPDTIRIIQLANRGGEANQRTIQPVPPPSSASSAPSSKKQGAKYKVDDLEGKGFNKKQLTQIILDKNKVIADLEETAYGGSQNHCCDTNYLDNILDSNTTSQNMIIHKEHFNSVPKYIKSLLGD